MQQHLGRYSIRVHASSLGKKFERASPRFKGSDP
jgi:hypothetical protein